VVAHRCGVIGVPLTALAFAGGAVIGVVSGALYGLNEENKKSKSAGEAYAECITRRG